MKVNEVLKLEGFNIIQYVEKDGDLFPKDYIAFDADAFGCIRASQILEKYGYKVFECYLNLSSVDGILEKPYGVITIC